MTFISTPLLTFLVHINFFILSNSKLHILRCINDLLEHLDTDAVRLQAWIY